MDRRLADFGYNFLEKERRFYEGFPEKGMVADSSGCLDSVPPSATKEVEEEEQRRQRASRVGYFVQKKIYDLSKGYKVSRVVQDKVPVLFPVEELNALVYKDCDS